jgi:hypothetical protein
MPQQLMTYPEQRKRMEQPAVQPVPARLPQPTNPYPAPKREYPFGYGRRLHTNFFNTLASQLPYSDDASQPVRGTPAYQMFKRVYEGPLRSREQVLSRNYSVAKRLYESMYPQASRLRPVIDDTYGKDNAFFGYPGGQPRISVGGGKKPQDVYPALAHESEHYNQRQLEPGVFGFYELSPKARQRMLDLGYADQDVQVLDDTAHKLSAEVPATLAGLLFSGEADRRAMRIPEHIYQSEGRIPFQPNYQPSVAWAREMARKHGVFDGTSITDLMAQNPQWVKLIAGAQ